MLAQGNYSLSTKVVNNVMQYGAYNFFSHNGKRKVL